MARVIHCSKSIYTGRRLKAARILLNLFPESSIAMLEIGIKRTCNEIRYLYTFVLMRCGLLAAFEIGTVTFRCFRCHGAQILQTYEGAPVHK